MGKKPIPDPPSRSPRDDVVPSRLSPPKSIQPGTTSREDVFDQPHDKATDQANKFNADTAGLRGAATAKQPTRLIRKLGLAIGALALLVLLLFGLRSWLFGTGDPTQVVGTETPLTDADVACTFTFHNLPEAELSRIEEIIREYAVDRVDKEESSDNERVVYSFTVAGGITRVATLDSRISYKPGAGEKKESVLMYDQFDARFSTNYRTASLKGSIETIVRFEVATGSKLFYSLERGKEIPVDETKIVNGNVQLEVRIPRNQQYIYARTILGRVEKFMRIDISTGEPENINRSTYINQSLGS